MMPASSTSWKRAPLKEGVPIPYHAAFDNEQFLRLKEGVIPKQMEDRWFIYYDEPHLFLHRSWTGQPVYRVTLKQAGNGAEVTEALLSKDLANTSEDADYQVQLIDFLVSNLLLRQHKPFPVPSDLAESKQGLFQHHISGTDYPATGEPKEKVIGVSILVAKSP